MANDLTPRDSEFFTTPLNFFEDFGRSFFDGFKGNMLKTDIHETETDYVLEAELPGIPKENIQINYDNGILTIEGQHKMDNEEKDEKGRTVRSERSYNSVRRQYAIKDVKDDEIKAAYQDGILKIVLPKSEQTSEPKKAIPIE